MANEKSPNNRPSQEMLDRLFGDVTQLSDEEIDALYEAVAPQDDPRQAVYRLAEQAAVTYRQSGQLPPDHVQAALDATRTPKSLEGTKSALKHIVDAIKPPTRGPVGDPSFAFHKRTELTDEDRRLLDEQTKELAEDWEDNNEQ